jgi:hypothetical protein
MIGIVSLLIALLWSVAASALDTVKTSQIANAPGWAASTSYPATQGVEKVTLSGGSGYAQNDIVTVSGGTTYNSLAAKLQLVVRGGSVTGYVVEEPGAYTTVPSCPCEVTGGSGSGLQVTITWTALTQRVVAGPGWTPGSPGRFNNGSALYLLEATTNGTSGATMPTISSCPRTGIVDGSVTWSCKTVVDYVTITGYLFDGPQWQPSTTYNTFQTVVNGSPLRAYTMDTRPTYAWNWSGTNPATCTTGTEAGPTGTGQTTNDGTCWWDYMGDITYTSKAGYIPVEFYEAHTNASLIQLQDYYVGNIWWGGAARPEYVPGSNGEFDPITFFYHSAWSGWAGVSLENRVLCKNGNSIPDCGGTIGTTFYTITLQAQSTDAFNRTATNPLNYNAANGVAIHAVTAPRSSFYLGQAHAGMAFDAVFEGAYHLTNLQIKSDHNEAFDMTTRAAFNAVTNDILDSGGGTGPYGYVAATGYKTDSWGFVYNDLIIFRGTLPGAEGLAFDYGDNRVANDTIVNLGGGASSVCGVIGGSLFEGPPSWTNDVCIGWTYPFVYGLSNANTGGVYAHLTSSITSSTTSIILSSACCSQGTYYEFIDSEIVGVTTNKGTSQTITRGQLGTTAAAHADNALVTGYPDPSGKDGFGPMENNAIDTPLATAPTAWTGFNGLIGGTVNLAGVGNTCGPPSNTSPCYGLIGSKQFVNYPSDFRLVSTAGLRGAGRGDTVKSAFGSIPNKQDIFGQTRPNGSSYDIGAEEFSASPSGRPAP